MGQPKLLLPLNGKTVIEHVVAAWLASRVTHLVAVVRADDVELARLCVQSGSEVVRPDMPPAQMKDSVAQALLYIETRYSPQDDDAWLLAPADMPGLSPRVIDRLLGEHERGSRPKAILVPTSNGRRGHPVLFPWPLAGEVRGLAEDEGVNILLERHPVREIACDESALPADLDTPDDYRRLCDP
jgi:molybdenum cofactor cytidylyltransferase